MTSHGSTGSQTTRSRVNHATATAMPPAVVMIQPLIPSLIATTSVEVESAIIAKTTLVSYLARLYTNNLNSFNAISNTNVAKTW